MDPNDVVGNSISPQNLNDLHNYLVTFNKEIEGNDPSTMSVITDGDCSDPSTDIYTSVQSLQNRQDSSSTVHFSTAFYSEQSLLDTSLGDDASNNMHSLVSGEDGVDNDISVHIKQEASSVNELDESGMVTVQAHLANLTSNMSDIAGSSQELIMTSVGDGLEAHEGKVIRIVSLGQDGSILSLGDGSQMQILNEDALQESSGIKDLPDMLEPLNQSNDSDVLEGNNSDSSDSPSTSTENGATSLHSMNDMSNGTTRIVTLGDGSQPQLVTMQSLEGISAGTLQVMQSDEDGVLSNTGPLILNTANTLQTFAIVPSEGQNGEVNYLLIVSQPDGSNKELTAQGISLDMNAVLDLKEEASELTEEIIEEDGTMKRILKIMPRSAILSAGTSELTCHYCNYTNPKRYLLTRHMKSHSQVRPYKCHICNRGFKTCASLTNHVNTHTGTRPHKCKLCDAAFTTSGELVRHVRYRHTFEKPHKCPECDYASVELSKLKRHLRSHTGERPYQCPSCSYASPDTYKLKRHMRIHTGEKPYECIICKARFTQSNSLKAHKLIHSGNKPVFQCQFCPTTCGRKTDLKIHMQKLHYSNEPLNCRKCGNSFPDRYTFKIHMKTHEGEKCYKCDECDYAACSQRHLESHILTHSGHKPFECDQCEHAFRQKQLLKRHKNLHHTTDYQPPPPRDKNHDCTACDKSFTHRGNLVRHMAQHTCDLSEDDNASGDAGGMSDGGSLRTVTADHILHGDLMQEWREGKLGNAPQVVIVHPDGRIEEVTPRLQMPPDRTVNDLLASVEGQSKADSSGSTSEEETAERKESLNSSKEKRLSVVRLESMDSEDDGNQREAGTQVELESDSEESSENEGERQSLSVVQHVKKSLGADHLLNDLVPSRGRSEVGGLHAALEGRTVPIFSTSNSVEVDHVIASLPIDATPVSVTLEPEQPQQLSGQTQLTLQSDKGSRVRQTEVSLGAGTRQRILVTVAGRPVSSATAVSPMVKTVTVMPGEMPSMEKKTRNLRKKDDVEHEIPAKRTRKALTDQRYTYI